MQAKKKKDLMIELPSFGFHRFFSRVPLLTYMEQSNGIIMSRHCKSETSESSVTFITQGQAGLDKTMEYQSFTGPFRCWMILVHKLSLPGLVVLTSLAHSVHSRDCVKHEKG